jgi:GTP-binding protein
VDDLNVVRRELELFQPTLAAKPQIVAANKIDALDEEARLTALERRAGELGLPFCRISAVSGAGLAELLEEMWRQLAAAREASAAEIDLSTRHDQRTDEQIPTR